jgi:hypothetical protein
MAWEQQMNARRKPRRSFCWAQARRLILHRAADLGRLLEKLQALAHLRFVPERFAEAIVCHAQVEQSDRVELLSCP